MHPLGTFAKKSWFIVNAIITRLDEEAWRFLAPHENKIICFDITEVLTFYCQIKTQGLEVIEYTEGLFINTTFKGSVAAFTTLFVSKQAIHHDLHIRGDLECAKALYDTWQHVDCDWEGAFAEATHPTLAQGLFQGLRRSRAWFNTVCENRTHDLSRYFHSEANLLPTQEEVNDFMTAVEKCRDDVARLEAKILLLIRKPS